MGSNNKTKTDYISVNTAYPDFSAAPTQVAIGYLLFSRMLQPAM